MSANTSKVAGPDVIGQPKFKFINSMIDFATVMVCFISAWTTAGGLKTVMESETMANCVAIGIAVVASVYWLVLNHWYPFADQKTKRSANWGILAFCVIIGFGSTLFSVISIGGRDAVAIHEQKTLQDARAEGLKYLQVGEKEMNLVAPLHTYHDVFIQLSSREIHGEISGVNGPGLVVASLKTTAEAFNNFAASIEATEEDRKKAYARLETALNEGQDLVVKQNSIKFDPQAYKDIQAQFAAVTGTLNKELAKLASLSSLRFIQEANNNLEQLTSVIGTGSNAQNAAIQALRQPIQAASTTLNKLISENKALGSTTPVTFEMIPEGYADLEVHVVHSLCVRSGYYAGLYAGAFLFSGRRRSYAHFRKSQVEGSLKILPGRIKLLKEDLQAARQARGYDEKSSAWRQYNPRVQALKDELASAQAELSNAQATEAA